MGGLNSGGLAAAEGAAGAAAAGAAAAGAPGGASPGMGAAGGAVSAGGGALSLEDEDDLEPFLSLDEDDLEEDEELFLSLLLDRCSLPALSFFAFRSCDDIARRPLRSPSLVLTHAQ